MGKNLDRALINPEWLNTCPIAYVSYETGGISDHSRSLVRLSQSSASVHKPFKFFNYLLDLPQFLPTVSRIWNDNSPLYHSRSALHRFHKQLKHLKFELRTLNKTQYGESMCNTFLWSGSPHNKHKAKVSWEIVCSLKSEGRLGLRSFKDSAIVFALNLIWRIFTLSGYLWVAWIKRDMLRNKSFWKVRKMGMDPGFGESYLSFETLLASFFALR